MLADMAIKIETARLITWKAAWLADQGLANNYESSIAKCYATDTCMQVTTDAVQIFGGYGYSKEYPVEAFTSPLTEGEANACHSCTRLKY